MLPSFRCYGPLHSFSFPWPGLCFTCLRSESQYARRHPSLTGLVSASHVFAQSLPARRRPSLTGPGLCFTRLRSESLPSSMRYQGPAQVSLRTFPFPPASAHTQTWHRARAVRDSTHNRAWKRYARSFFSPSPTSAHKQINKPIAAATKCDPSMGATSLRRVTPLAVKSPRRVTSSHATSHDVTRCGRRHIP